MTPKYKWRTHDVSGKPAGTIGNEDLESIEETGKEEIFAVNVASGCTAYIVTRELVPVE